MAGRIVCVERVPCRQHGHIVAVGVGSRSGRARLRLSVEEISAEIRRGGRFYVEKDGLQLTVQARPCGCGSARTLTTTEDTDGASALDGLRTCVWRPDPDRIP